MATQMKIANVRTGIKILRYNLLLWHVIEKGSIISKKAISSIISAALKKWFISVIVRNKTVIIALQIIVLVVFLNLGVRNILQNNTKVTP